MTFKSDKQRKNNVRTEIHQEPNENLITEFSN